MKLGNRCGVSLLRCAARYVTVVPLFFVHQVLNYDVELLPSGVGQRKPNLLRTEDCLYPGAPGVNFLYHRCCPCYICMLTPRKQAMR